MSDIERQARLLLERYAAAVLAKDVETFLALYSPEVRVFDAWETWSYEGREAWAAVPRDWFASLGPEAVAVTWDEVAVTGAGAMAVVSAIVTYARLSASGERLRSLQNRMTWVLRHEERGLAILHEHSSCPVSLEDYRGLLSRPGA